MDAERVRLFVEGVIALDNNGVRNVLKGNCSSEVCVCVEWR
jgi:hypothetical protein